MKSFIRKFRRYWVQDVSFISLLVVQLITIFIVPIFIENHTIGMGLFNVLILFLFFVGIWSAENIRLILVSASLFSIHLVLKLIRFSDTVWEFPIFEQIIASMNTLVFIMINVRLLFRDGEYNFERVIGAVNVYLLLALLGAFLFDIIFLLTGSSIEGNLHLLGKDEDFVHYIYFSLVSLTTVGYGDIYPSNHAARMLSVFLSSLGILFPAVVIARLISARNQQ